MKYKRRKNIHWFSEFTFALQRITFLLESNSDVEPNETKKKKINDITIKLN